MDETVSQQIEELVKAFRNDNGNKHFTNKELIIYFNKKHEADIKEIKRILESLPCTTNATRITKIETTNKLIAASVTVVLTIFGIIISIIK